MKKFLLISLLFLLAIPALAVPQKIYLQGILRDQNDNLLNGSYNIIFRIYDSATGGTALWTEIQSNVQINNGLYTVVLGSSTPLTADFFSEDNRYVGVQVGNDPEMSPRIQLLSVPFAMHADTVDGYNASDFALSSGNYVLLGPLSPQTTSSAEAINVTTTNVNGKGVSGIVSAATGTNFGLYGKTNSLFGYGVRGEGPNSAVLGSLAAGTDGVRGETNIGRGIYGRASDTTATNFGGFFSTASPWGNGVYATNESTATSAYLATNNRGVWGSATAGTAWGGYFEGGKGLYASKLSVNNIWGAGFNTIGGGPVYSIHMPVSDADDLVIDGNLEVEDIAYFDNGIRIDSKNGVYTAGSLEVAGIGSRTGVSSNVYYDQGQGLFYFIPSSRKYKANIKAFKTDFSKILAVEPKSFTDKNGSGQDIGYIAEEFDELGLKELVVYQNGEPESLKYDRISLYLLEVIKEQQKLVSKQQKQIVKLEEENNQIKAQFKGMETKLVTILDSIEDKADIKKEEPISMAK